MKQTLWTYKARNQIQNLLLLVTLALLMAYLASLLGGATLAWMAVIATVMLFLFNPVGVSSVVLSMNRAYPLWPREAPQLYRILHLLSARADLPAMPQLYLVPSPLLNAFATGHTRDSAIALSEGLVRRLNRRELAAVMAHEMSHIANGDLRTMAFASLVGHVTRLLSLLGQLLLLFSMPWWLVQGTLPPLVPILVLLGAPLATALIQLALSRNHEFEADRRAVELCGDPEGLASALRKLEQHNQPFWEQWFMPRRQPTRQYHTGWQWLRTHPPTEERIARLLELREDFR